MLADQTDTTPRVTCPRCGEQREHAPRSHGNPPVVTVLRHLRRLPMGDPRACSGSYAEVPAPADTPPGNGWVL